MPERRAEPLVAFSQVAVLEARRAGIVRRPKFFSIPSAGRSRHRTARPRHGVCVLEVGMVYDANPRNENPEPWKRTRVLDLKRRIETIRSLFERDFPARREIGAVSTVRLCGGLTRY